MLQVKNTMLSLFYHHCCYGCIFVPLGIIVQLKNFSGRVPVHNSSWYPSYTRIWRWFSVLLTKTAEHSFISITAVHPMVFWLPLTSICVTGLVDLLLGSFGTTLQVRRLGDGYFIGEFIVRQTLIIWHIWHCQWLQHGFRINIRECRNQRFSGSMPPHPLVTRASLKQDSLFSPSNFKSCMKP